MKANSQGGKCFGFGEHSLKYTEFFSLGYVLGEMFNYSWFYVELRVESIFLDRHLLEIQLFQTFGLLQGYLKLFFFQIIKKNSCIYLFLPMRDIHCFVGSLLLVLRGYPLVVVASFVFFSLNFNFV